MPRTYSENSEPRKVYQADTIRGFTEEEVQDALKNAEYSAPYTAKMEFLELTPATAETFADLMAKHQKGVPIIGNLTGSFGDGPIDVTTADVLFTENMIQFVFVQTLLQTNPQKAQFVTAVLTASDNFDVYLRTCTIS